MQSQVPQFKAQPLPDFETVVLPEKKKLEATKPEPFRLLIDQRGAVRSTRLEKMVRRPFGSRQRKPFPSPLNNAVWNVQVKDEQKQLKESTVFKAKPNVVTHKEPFQPRRESRAAVGKSSSRDLLIKSHYRNYRTIESTCIYVAPTKFEKNRIFFCYYFETRELHHLQHPTIDW